MKAKDGIWKRALESGTCASLASTAALLHGGTRDCADAMAPVNAVSHWIWADKALRQQKPSLRYSLVGFCIHHMAAILWALAYEKLLIRRSVPTAKETAVCAAAVASVACVVDLRCTPERLTPGFERRLSNKSLMAVYVAFGLGLALHTVLRSK